VVRLYEAIRRRPVASLDQQVDYRLSVPYEANIPGTCEAAIEVRHLDWSYGNPCLVALN
jgi:hypothetical protein